MSFGKKKHEQRKQYHFLLLYRINSGSDSSEFLLGLSTAPFTRHTDGCLTVMPEESGGRKTRMRWKREK
jgi:hypothetical protein